MLALFHRSTVLSLLVVINKSPCGWEDSRSGPKKYSKKENRAQTPESTKCFVSNRSENSCRFIKQHWGEFIQQCCCEAQLSIHVAAESTFESFLHLIWSDSMESILMCGVFWAGFKRNMKTHRKNPCVSNKCCATAPGTTRGMLLHLNYSSTLIRWTNNILVRTLSQLWEIVIYLCSPIPTPPESDKSGPSTNQRLWCLVPNNSSPRWRSLCVNAVAYQH